MKRVVPRSVMTMTLFHQPLDNAYQGINTIRLHVNNVPCELKVNPCLSFSKFRVFERKSKKFIKKAKKNSEKVKNSEV